MAPLKKLLGRYPELGETSLDELASHPGSKRKMMIRFPNLQPLAPSVKGKPLAAFRRWFVKRVLCYRHGSAVP